MKTNYLFLVISLLMLIAMGGCSAKEDNYTVVNLTTDNSYSAWETIYTFHHVRGTIVKAGNGITSCVCYVENDEKPQVQPSRLLLMVGLPDEYKKEGTEVIFSGTLKSLSSVDMDMAGRTPNN